MSESNNIRKLGGDKIALLGLFALSLLTARFVVGLKSVLVLSEPIPLRNRGLSASVPTGNGWQILQKWAPDGNSRVLSSAFTLGTGHRTAWVTCRYRRDTDTASPQMRFEREAADLEGYVVDIRELTTPTLSFLRAHIRGHDRPVTLFLGTTILPDGGQFDVEVYEGTGDADQAETAFKRVIETVRFEQSGLRTAAHGAT
jgi:hypothetical protein